MRYIPSWRLVPETGLVHGLIASSLDGNQGGTSLRVILGIVSAPTSFRKVNSLILSQELHENAMRDHHNVLFLGILERLDKFPQTLSESARTGPDCVVVWSIGAILRWPILLQTREIQVRKCLL